jgi:hypothetical protein
MVTSWIPADPSFTGLLAFMWGTGCVMLALTGVGFFIAEKWFPKEKRKVE